MRQNIILAATFLFLWVAGAQPNLQPLVSVEEPPTGLYTLQSLELYDPQAGRTNWTILLATNSGGAPVRTASMELEDVINGQLAIGWELLGGVAYDVRRSEYLQAMTIRLVSRSDLEADLPQDEAPKSDLPSQDCASLPRSVSEGSGAFLEKAEGLACC